MEASPSRRVYLAWPREPLAAPVRPGIALETPRPPPQRPYPDPRDIDCLAGWLAEAANPLIITAGLGRNLDEVEKLATLAGRFALPVAAFNPRFLCLSTEHPMHAGFETAALVPRADLILALESDVPWIPSLTSAAPGAKVVHVGEDPTSLRYPIRTFPSNLAITADVGVVVEQLHAALAQ